MPGATRRVFAAGGSFAAIRPGRDAAGAAWIDGRYCPVQQAAISVLDLGVTRSDACYDVVHVWDGRFYRLDAHLDRFAASLTRLRLLDLARRPNRSAPG